MHDTPITTAPISPTDPAFRPFSLSVLCDASAPWVAAALVLMGLILRKVHSSLNGWGRGVSADGGRGTGQLSLAERCSAMGCRAAGCRGVSGCRGDAGRRELAHADGAVHVLVALGGEVRGAPVDGSDRRVLVLAVAVQAAEV